HKFSGDGSGLSALNATQISAGTVNDARLSGNVARLDGAPVFSSDVSVGATHKFSGSGAGLTALNATQLSSGTVDDTRLSGNVALLNMGAAFASTVSAASFSTVGNVTA